MSSEIVIKVENLSKCYQIYDKPRDRLKQMILPRLLRAIGIQPKQYFREFWALRDASFEIRKGETVGIIGRNGSGKSTLLQMICGTLNPTSGSIQTNGRIAALLELGSGFNPEFTGRENVYLNGAVLGLSKEEINKRFDKIVAFADIGDFIDQPVKTYSSGMFVRLAFSIQANVDPEILIVDEALAVGDVFFVHRCMSKLRELQEKKTTVLFVSHDTTAVKTLCDRALWIKSGVISKNGKASQVADAYLLDDYEFKGERESSGTGEDPIKNDSYKEKKYQPLRPTKRICGGLLVVESGAVLGEDGEVINQVFPDKTITLKLIIKNKSVPRNANLIVGYVLRNIRGVDISSNNNEVEGVRIGAPDKTGVLVMEIKFKIPFLHPGPYAISVSVAERCQDGSIQGLDYLENVFRIDVLEKKKCHVLMTFETEYSCIFSVNNEMYLK
ncbi:MAG: ABC transporter ATP-binding protein [Betaproteobacteria bacterium]|nr:ABC transporter ATP-binding protein [Betaproteobacteria bacterium]